MKNILLTILVLFSCQLGFSQGFLVNFDTSSENRIVSGINNFSIDETSSEEFLITQRGLSTEPLTRHHNVGVEGDVLSEFDLEYGYLSRLHVLDDDSYIILSSAGFPNDSSSQIVAARYTRDQTLLWSNTYTEFSSSTYFNSINGTFILSDGLLVYGSRSNDDPIFDPFGRPIDVQPYMFKIDWDGTKQWEVSLPIKGNFTSKNNFQLDRSNTTDYEYFEEVENSILDTIIFIAGVYNLQELELEIDTNGEIISQREANRYEDFKLADLPIEREEVREFKLTKILTDDGEILLSEIHACTSTFDPVTEKYTKMAESYSCVSKFDKNRKRIWFKILDQDPLFFGVGHVNLTNNGNIIYIPGSTEYNSRILDENNGDIIATKEINSTVRNLEIFNVFEKDGYYMCVSYIPFDLKSKIVFFKIDINDLTSYDFQETIITTEDIIRLQTVRAISNNEFAGVGSIGFSNKRQELFVFRADENGAIFSNLITGNVYGDLDFDCQIDTSDLDLKLWEIIAQGNQNFKTFSDYEGNYCLQVDTGIYELSIIPKNDFWLNCDTTVVEFNNFFDTLSNIDLITSAITPCSFVEVDVGFGFLRRCFSNSVKVQYCNQGTFAEENTMVELHLDPYLDVDSTSVPIVNQEDTTLFFDVGFLEIGECGSFTIQVTPNCDDTVLGQEHCINAHVFPDTLCVPQDSLWSGANVVVEAICLGDSVLFNIINRGVAPTKDDLAYIVIVDDIIVSRSEMFSLAAGDTLQFVEFEPGSTITVIADQEPFHPAGNQVGLEAFCAGTDFDFISSFNQFDDDPFTDMVCVENRGSYDPNDKAAIPLGSGPEHFIPANQELEYKIRFQNTGTDTAFTVVIRDTISNLLDMSTFESGISSHDYVLDIEEENILVFTFNNILLPDSTVNWTASNGFVEFKISPIAEVVPDDKIENSAAIFFDFNEPIITNTVLRTIETPVRFSMTSVEICANDMYDGVFYTQDTMLSELIATPFLDSFAITELHILPVDSVVEFVTVPFGTQINNETITSDTTIIETLLNSAGCDSILIRNIMVENSTAVSLVDRAHWDIFPNPVQEFLTIRTNQEFSNRNYLVTLHSILGEVVYEKYHEFIPNENIELNVKGFAAGTYILSISSKHGSLVEKIVIHP